MKQEFLSVEQQAKLAEALSLSKLAVEKAEQMSKLATAIADKYQKYIYDMASKHSN